MGKKIVRFFAYVLTAAVFLFGVVIFIYPLLSGYMSEHNSAVCVKNFENSKRSFTENQNSSSEKGGNSKSLKKLYKEMKMYNADIYKNHQEGLCDAWAYEQSSINLSEFGINSGAVGALRVPKMGNLEMPIFLGASRNNMSMGAAQLGETSMPIGGKNTNCVLAGHRGWSGARYFLDIEQLQLGDKVYIENFWETLSYAVTDIQVISPDDIQKIFIQKNKDMVTLITCHPYWASTYRYVVFCERVYDEDAKTDVDTPTQNNTMEIDKTSQTRIFLEKISYVVIPVILVALYVFLLIRRRKSNRRSM
ncbi:MAG: class C sortase [Ruminococcus sp.]|nr:class C sortase [Ruminococcus sp.]